MDVQADAKLIWLDDMGRVTIQLNTSEWPVISLKALTIPAPA